MKGLDYLPRGPGGYRSALEGPRAGRLGTSDDAPHWPAVGGVSQKAKIKRIRDRGVQYIYEELLGRSKLEKKQE